MHTVHQHRIPIREMKQNKIKLLFDRNENMKEISMLAPHTNQ